jgi:hypothetical protein
MITTNNSTGLLDVFSTIQVRNEEKISPADLAFCKEQQKKVEEALQRIDCWYWIFYQAATELKETHNATFNANGSVYFRRQYNSRSLYSDDYSNYDFLPFESLNQIVGNRIRIIEVFEATVIRYFNFTYNLSVSVSETDRENLPVDFIPQYMSCVDTVIAHLGGHSFRETAENELIRRIHGAVHRYNSHFLPEIKGKSIIFHNIVSFDDIHLQYHNKYRISWGESKNIETLCAGLAFYGQNRINGDSGIICGFSRDDVNLSEWYPLSTSPAEYIKFYKNGRVDVKFSDAASAGDCFQKLKLHEL